MWNSLTPYYYYYQTNTPFTGDAHPYASSYAGAHQTYTHFSGAPHQHPTHTYPAAPPQAVPSGDIYGTLSRIEKTLDSHGAALERIEKKLVRKKATESAQVTQESAQVTQAEAEQPITVKTVKVRFNTPIYLCLFYKSKQNTLMIAGYRERSSGPPNFLIHIIMFLMFLNHCDYLLIPIHTC